MVEDLQQAYQTMGLFEGAPKDEVERRYELLLRQYRAQQRSGQTDEGIEQAFSEVTRAYRFIIEHEEKKGAEEISQQHYGKYKRFAGFAEKADHFFSYYKWHVIGALAAVVAIVYGINSYLDYREEQARLAALPPIDIHGMLLGEIVNLDGTAETERLEDALLAQFPEWQRVELEILTFRSTIENELDIAMQQKAMVQLAVERPDVYIMDRDTFAWIARSDVLLPLDDYVAGLSVKPSEDMLYRSTIREETEERIYGIDLQKSPLADSLPIAAKDLIIAIRINAERPENAKMLIERYLQALEGP